MPIRVKIPVQVDAVCVCLPLNIIAADCRHLRTNRRIVYAVQTELADCDAVGIAVGHEMNCYPLQKFRGRYSAIRITAAVKCVKSLAKLTHDDLHGDVFSCVHCSENQNLIRAVGVAEDDVIDTAPVNSVAQLHGLHLRRKSVAENFHVVQKIFVGIFFGA